MKNLLFVLLILLVAIPVSGQTILQYGQVFVQGEKTEMGYFAGTQMTIKADLVGGLTVATRTGYNYLNNDSTDIQSIQVWDLNIFDLKKEWWNLHFIQGIAFMNEFKDGEDLEYLVTKFEVGFRPFEFLGFGIGTDVIFKGGENTAFVYGLINYKM